MNLADIIALAKQGYKPQDIKELIALADGENAVGENADGENAVGENAVGENADGENADGENAVGENAVGENADGENADGENADGENADGENGKSEMEQLVNQLKAQNKNLQDALKRMDLSGEQKTESASEILKETLSSLF